MEMIPEEVEMGVVHTEAIDKRDPQTEREFEMLDVKQPEAKDDQYIKQKTNANIFMSTAPIKINYGNSTYNKKFMGKKETKKDLKLYAQKLEEALARVRTTTIELERDHEILNKTYMKELKKGDYMHRILKKVK